MTVNTVYFEGRMVCFSLLLFSKLTSPLLSPAPLSRSSPLSSHLVSFPSPFLLSPVFTLLPRFSHPSSLSSFFSFLPFSLSFPPFPTLPLSHPSSPFYRFHYASSFSSPSSLPSFSFLPLSYIFPVGPSCIRRTTF